MFQSVLVVPKLFKKFTTVLVIAIGTTLDFLIPPHSRATSLLSVLFVESANLSTRFMTLMVPGGAPTFSIGAATATASDPTMEKSLGMF